MFVTGAAWITVLSSLQVSAQIALPAWVRARGLAVFMVVFMGGMAVGSLVWGHLAAATTIPAALTVAAAGALAAIAVTWRFKLGGHDSVDLAPSMHWPAPIVTDDVQADRGPVMVTIDYRIDPAQKPQFVAAMQEMQRVRRRDGAFYWQLFQDAADAARLTECFMNESWLDHLRQHERVTNEDRAVQQRIDAFHVGPELPRATHFIAAR
jgi:hypothetical protein